MLVVHRVVDWAPCLPGKQKGSSHSESWSEVSDRIDGWWKQKPPQDSRTRALVSSAEKILGRKIRRALPLAPRLVSLDRANAIIEGAQHAVPGKDARLPVRHSPKPVGAAYMAPRPSRRLLPVVFSRPPRF